MLPAMRERLMRLARSRLEARLRARGYSQAAADDAVRALRESLGARAGAARRRRAVIRGSQIVALAPGRVELLPLEIPLAGPHEVTIELLASVVSPGTERAQYLRLPNAQVGFPYRPGYSGAGRVVAVGGKVSGIRDGDLVAVPRVPHASVATVAAARVYPLPRGVRAEDAALVYLAMISGYGVRRAALSSDTAFGVVGYGTIGALAQRLASVRGAGPATVIAASTRREQLASAGGAAFVVGDPEGLELPVVIEATGDPAAFATAVAAAAPGGRIVLLGSPRGTSELPFDELRRKRLELVGAHISALAAEARRDGGDPFRELAEDFLQALAASRIDVADLVNVVVDPREAGSFYRRLATDGSVLGARFDWSLVPDAERSRRGGLLSRPRLPLDGFEPDSVALPAPDVAPPPCVHVRGPSFRVGLLGCGEIGAQNARAIAAAEGVELTACFDPVETLAQDVSARFGGRPCRTPDELFASQLDAVLVATPHHLHAPLALDAIAAGLHVMVEKPLALNVAEAEQIVRAAASADVLLSTCFPYRYEAHVAAARRLVAAGAVGDANGVLVNYASDKPPSYWLGGFSGRAVAPWRASRSKAGGGVVIMNLCHYLDFVRYVGGLEAQTVVGSVDRSGGDAVEDTAAAAITYTNGAVGSVFGSSAVRGAAFSEFRLWGDAGQVLLEPRARVYTLRAVEGVTPGRWHELPPPGPEDVRAVYVERFAAAVHSGSPPDISGEDGLAVQAIMDALYESAARGEAVRPEDLLPVAT
jgi:2-desacetyl-2-hydroxyethyl bacteriochlorophyllide A dehydrogenase